jgi:hypothetical protein
MACSLYVCTICCGSRILADLFDETDAEEEIEMSILAILGVVLIVIIVIAIL